MPVIALDIDEIADLPSAVAIGARTAVSDGGDPLFEMLVALSTLSIDDDPGR